MEISVPIVTVGIDRRVKLNWGEIMEDNKIEVTAESLATPEPLRSFMADPSADDVIGVTYCILCGEEIPVHRYETFERRACVDCKRAFKRMKGKLPEED